MPPGTDKNVLYQPQPPRGQDSKPLPEDWMQRQQWLLECSTEQSFDTEELSMLLQDRYPLNADFDDLEKQLQQWRFRSEVFALEDYFPQKFKAQIILALEELKQDALKELLDQLEASKKALLKMSKEDREKGLFGYQKHEIAISAVYSALALIELEEENEQLKCIVSAVINTGSGAGARSARRREVWERELNRVTTLLRSALPA